MSTISYDGQSFLIDGRRVWLVSGSIHYPRVPRELWRSRIRAAKQAGLNCIETYVFWNLHEPRPGVFNFQDQADLRHFVQLVGQEGMYCILRPGPYIGAKWDFGGLPPWLLRVPGLKLRQASPEFLEACARYLSAVMEQVADLQVARPSALGVASPVAGVAGGPILLMQAENEWFCTNREQGETYLRELVRHLREYGCTVPICVGNNLWQRVDGTIDTWSANRHLAADLRQLAVVQPEAPRLVSQYWPGGFDCWGQPQQASVDPQLNLYRLAQVPASAAQYNLYMFHGGTNFGFWGGRAAGQPDCFLTTSYDSDAPLTEAGGRGQKYDLVKRLSMFASQFGQLLAHMNEDEPHAAVNLIENDHPLSLIHQRGSQGQVVFLIKGPDDPTTQTQLLLSDGTTLDVPIGEDRVAWLVLRANLAGVAELTYTNLRPWAFVNRQMLVLFGPAGASAAVSLNGSPLRVSVPTGQTPLVERHEDLTVVVLNTEQVDAAYVTPQGLVVGALGLDEENRPLPRPGWDHAFLIASDGTQRRQPMRRPKLPTAPRLIGWEQAVPTDMLDGSSASYLPLDGPASLEELECPFGYGWYRLNVKGSPGGTVLAPRAADRLHVFTRGKPEALLGLGPGAEYNRASVRLRNPTVVLADNLGRFSAGWQLGERKGLFGHIYAVRPLRLDAPKIVPGKAPDIFALGGFWSGMRRGEEPPADALVWKFKVTGRNPVILDVQGFPLRTVVLINNQPVAAYVPCSSGRFLRLLLEYDETVRAGGNELKLALYRKFEGDGRGRKGSLDPRKFIQLYQTTANLTAAAQWAFAPWVPPAAEAFGRTGRPTGGKPCWHRCRFNVASAAAPLWLEPNGLSKGQIYLNGHNVGRYFVATATGQAVPPQQRYYLPEPWLKVGQPNELLLFDEHGKRPNKCRLVYDPMGPYGK